MPHRPAHRRYRLRFAGILYIIITFFVGLAAVNSRTNLMYWLFALMLSSVVISGFYSGAMLMGLWARRLVCSHAAVGSPLLVHYELVNRNRLIPCFGLNIADSPRYLDAAAGKSAPHPVGWVLHLPAQTTHHFHAQFTPTHRGVIRLDAFDIHSGFPIGLVRKSLLFKQVDELIVMPRIHPLRKFSLGDLFQSDASGRLSSRELGGHEDFYGLREHRPGDNLRLIHWRRSARSGALMTRQMTRPRPVQLMVLLDLRPGAHTAQQAELAIELAASFIAAADAEGFAAGLAVAGAHSTLIKPRPGRDQRRQLLHALAVLDLTKTGDGGEVIPKIDQARYLVISPLPAASPIGPPAALRLVAADLPRFTAALAPDSPKPKPEAAA